MAKERLSEAGKRRISRAAKRRWREFREARRKGDWRTAKRKLGKRRKLAKAAA